MLFREELRKHFGQIIQRSHSQFAHIFVRDLDLRFDEMHRRPAQFLRLAAIWCRVIHEIALVRSLRPGFLRSSSIHLLVRLTPQRLVIPFSSLGKAWMPGNHTFLLSSMMQIAKSRGKSSGFIGRVISSFIRGTVLACMSVKYQDSIYDWLNDDTYVSDSDPGGAILLLYA